jgi:hypothetical protein
MNHHFKDSGAPGLKSFNQIPSQQHLRPILRLVADAA